MRILMTDMLGDTGKGIVAEGIFQERDNFQEKYQHEDFKERRSKGQMALEQVEKRMFSKKFTS